MTDKCVVFPGHGQSTHSYVVVADCFFIEDATALGDLIERTGKGFKVREDLEGLASRRPGGEARNTGEHYRGVRKEVGKWPRLVRTDASFFIILAVREERLYSHIIFCVIHDAIADNIETNLLAWMAAE
jgi:hypothetical protein